MGGVPPPRGPPLFNSTDMKPLHLLAPAAALLLLAGCGKHEPPTAHAAPTLPAVKVRVAPARVEHLPVITEVAGVVRPAQRAQLAAKIMGPIEEMPVTLGQRVRAGDLLVKISAGEISARVTQAQSQLNAARRDLERERSLVGKGASTADLVRGLEDRFAASEAMVREAEAMFGYTMVRAPFDGVIARKLANAGDLASPGFPLLEIEGTADFQVEAGVPDSLAARLAPGAAIVVEAPAVGSTFTGKLAELSPAADPNAYTVLAKIDLPSTANVRSGQYARVQVPGAPVAAIVVPASAVTRIGQMDRVFVAENAGASAAGGAPRAALRLVKTGAARGDRVEILAGLDPDERVVVDVPAGLREGQPLEIVP